MAVKVWCVEAPITFEVDGQHFEARVDRTSGIWLNRSYRGERVSGRSLDEIKTRIHRLDEEAAAKADRLKALKAAAESPIPALDLQLNPIFVRGIDRRSGNVLVTSSGGEKSQVRSETILRVLTPDELAEVRDARDSLQAAKDAIPDTPTVKSAVDDLELTARFDSQSDCFVLDFEGTTYTGRSLFGLSSQITKILVLNQGYEWYWDGRDFQSIADHNELPSYVPIFKSSADAKAWWSAQEAREAASAKLKSIHDKYLFDFSRFETDGQS